MTPTSVSFVIPMYNESETIGKTIDELVRIARDITRDYDIIIADDCSTDGSSEVVGKKAQENPRVRCVRLRKNTKFGGALKAGLKEARKDVIIYTDSDLPVDIHDIKGALSILDNTDIVTAYSKVKKGENLKRVIISKVYNFLIQSLFRTGIKDINSGFKIYKRKVVNNMQLISQSPFVDVEIFVKAMRKNFIIKQYPVLFKHREKGKSYISRPAVVFQTMLDMLRFRFSR